MGIQPIQWDVDSLDWKDYDAATITQRGDGKGWGQGPSSLFHNAALHTPEALPGILEYLLGQGYDIVPVSQLVLPGEEGVDYTIDHTGRQCPVEGSRGVSLGGRWYRYAVPLGRRRLHPATLGRGPGRHRDAVPLGRDAG